jgi:transposase-like protein
MTKKIDAEILDELLKGCDRPEALLGEGGLMRDLKRALIQRMLEAELTEHLGYEQGEVPPPVQPNRRNGNSRKTVKGESGAFEIDVPRDREGSFEPQLIAKGQTRIDGLDEKIIAMYARGMSVRDIRSHLEELYGIAVSPDLISRVTDAVLDEVKEWRSRALDAVYPVVIFDALRVRVRDKAAGSSKTRRSIWRSASPAKAPARFWGSGSQRMRAPSSGSR